MMKLRPERSRHTRSASARRAPGFGLRLEPARLERAVEVRGVEPDERPAHLAVDRRSRPRTAGAARARRAGRGRSARAPRPRTRTRSGPSVLGGREERAVLHPQLEILEAQRHPARAPGRGPSERCTRPSIWPASCRVHDGPAPRAPLDPEPPVGDPRPGLGRLEDLHVGVEARRPLGGLGRRRKLRAVSSDAKRVRSAPPRRPAAPGTRSPRARASPGGRGPARRPRAARGRRPRRRRVRRGARCPRARRAHSERRHEGRSGRASRARVEESSGAPGGRPQVDHRPPTVPRRALL